MVKHDRLGGLHYSKDKAFLLRSAYQKLRSCSHSLESRLFANCKDNKSQLILFFSDVALLNFGQKSEIALSHRVSESCYTGKGLHSMIFVIFLKTLKNYHKFEYIFKDCNDDDFKKIAGISEANRKNKKYVSSILQPKDQISVENFAHARMYDWESRGA